MQHKPTIIIPHFLKLSIITILPNAAIHEKNPNLGGLPIYFSKENTITPKSQSCIIDYNPKMMVLEGDQIK